MRLVATSLILFATTLTAQGAPAKKPEVPKLTTEQRELMERNGIRCGLGKDFHRGRREELLRRLPDGAVFVLRGLPPIRDYIRFQQDKTFWYLTGVETPDAALVLDKDSGRQILLLPRRSPRLAMTEAWDGEMWDTGDEWVAAVSGFTDIEKNADLLKVLQGLQKDKTTFYTSLHPLISLSGGYDKARPANSRQRRDPWDGRRSRRSVFRSKLEDKLGVETKTADRILYDMRRVKTAEEIEAMRRAAKAGALGIVEAMRSTRPGIKEQELEGVIDLVTRRHGSEGPAYQAIIGSGRNSLVLHYIGNKRAMRDGEVVLCDYGPQIDHYTTDITRTWPVGGKFTEKMAELYDAVLAAQEAGLAAARPASSIAKVDAACARVLRKRGFGRFIRHGSCHLIGMEVHDPGVGVRYMRQPLEPGVVFTIEPGLYDPATGIGVRIEDTIVITKDGCDVLSKDAPRDRKTIEKLIAEKGVLDWLDSDRQGKQEKDKR